MKWITRSHLHVDRVEGPWLSRRFVASDLEFLFVPGYQIEKGVQKTSDILFDTRGTEPGHHEGRCSSEWCRLDAAGAPKS